jgi:peptide/nickel transport system permease protein
MSDGALHSVSRPSTLVAARIANSPERIDAMRRFWRVFTRNRLGAVGLWLVIGFLFLATIGVWIAPYDPNAQDLPAQLQGPSWAHLLGTDDYGRDILSRILVGSRISLFVGVIATGIGAGIGTTIGLLAGFYRPLDGTLMRCMDVLLSFPSVLLAIGIIAILGPSLVNVMIAVGINSIPAYARLVRSTVLSVKESDYISAARTIGRPEAEIMVRHVLPNCLSPIIVYSTLQVGTAILTASILSFLGLGVQPPDPEWGQMVNAGRGWLAQAPHIATFPGLAIFLVVMGFNLLGDGLRDVLDPRLRNVS